MSSSTQPRKDDGSPSPEQIGAELEKILSSSLFRSSDRPSRFLRYCVESTLAGDLGRLKEYSIGIEVLGRKETFDPRTDTMVRVEASRLRGRLADYYQTEGSHDPVRIELPKGSYMAVFRSEPEASDREERRTQSPRFKALIIAIPVLLIALAAVAIWAFLRPATKLSPAETMKITRLTTTGTAVEAAISPDGRYVAYVEQDKGQDSIRIRQTGTASDIELLPPRQGQYLRRLIFAPDGNFIYYAQSETGNYWALYAMPSLGGASRKVLDDIDGAPSFSPDGKQIVFRRSEPSPLAHRLFRFDLQSRSEREIASRRAPDFISASVTWSSDGSKIFGMDRNSRNEASLVVIPLDGGREQTIPLSKKWLSMPSDFSILGDSKTMIAVARDEGLRDQLWEQLLSSTEPRRITNDLSNYRGVSLSAGGNALVTVQADLDTNIWLISGGSAKQITSGSGGYFGSEGLAWTADGQLLYASREGGSSDIWSIDAEGGNRKQLTSDGASRRPHVCGSGGAIVYSKLHDKIQELWRMNADGGQPKGILTGRNVFNADCPVEGDWVVAGGNDGALYKIPLDGGQPFRLTSGDFTPSYPAVSRDGKKIAFSYNSSEPGARLAIMPSAGGAPQVLFKTGSQPLRHWTPDGRSIGFVPRARPSNIWIEPLDGSPPKQLTNFDSQEIVAFAWSRDGSRLAIARGTPRNDVVLITNFR